MTDALDDIAAELRRQQDAQLKQRSLPSLIVDSRPVQEGFSPMFAVFGVVATAAVVVAIAVRPAPTTPSPSEAPSDGPVHAPAPLAFKSTARGFAFNDGSKVDVTGEAHVRFVDDRGATVAVDSGAVAASFLPREKAAWAVEAGPYALRTEGARLDVAYDGAHLVVHVLDGTALLSSPSGVQTLAAGSTVDVAAPSSSPPPYAPPTLRPKSSMTPATPSTTSTVPTTTTTSAAATTAVEAPVAPATDMEPAPGPAPTLAPSQTWQELARADKHSEAVTEVRRLGLSDVVNAANADDLVLLGTSARLVVDTDVAERAYATVRTRYAGTPQAAQAAFFLARFAADVRHDDDSAVRLLRIYLREDAGGALVEEARGRLVEILARAHSPDAAAEARAYLAAFPDGPHAALAKAQLR